ncbi:TetR/AcrR family transcriptional regulator [Arenimonas fontis]
MPRAARPPTPPGRPKDLEKRAAILEAAKLLFPERGYEGTSMDAIAQAAGVSKLTVYSHFQDKDTLFVEAVKAKCEDLLPSDLFLKRTAEPWERQLHRIAQAFFRLINSDEAIAVARVLARQMSEDAHLPRLFWEAGPKRTQEALAGFLRAGVQSGAVDIPDCDLAASQLCALLKGEHHARLMCGCQERLDAEQERRHIEATVDLFLRAYGRRTAPAHA